MTVMRVRVEQFVFASSVESTQGFRCIYNHLRLPCIFEICGHLPLSICPNFVAINSEIQLPNSLCFSNQGRVTACRQEFVGKMIP